MREPRDTMRLSDPDRLWDGYERCARHIEHLQRRWTVLCRQRGRKRQDAAFVERGQRITRAIGRTVHWQRALLQAYRVAAR